MTDRLVGHYSELQAGLPIEDDANYEPLVTPNGNAEAAFHRWFHMKEGFSCELLPRVLADAGLDQRTALAIVDPFVGSGTTVMSAACPTTPSRWRISTAVGIERNPWLAFLSATKARSLSAPPTDFRRYVRRVLDRASGGRVRPAPTPGLSTFANTAYFPPSTMRALLELRAAIDAGPQDLRSDLARVSLAAAVEPVSKLRRDGRALRFEQTRQPATVLDEFERRAKLIAEDLDLAEPGGSVQVLHGDGRRPVSAAGLKRSAFDLALFSPPYLNNIDYTEVYKMEAWILGLIADQNEFRDQRRLTVRSHPSVKVDATLCATDLGLKEEFEQLMKPLVDAVPETPHRRWRVPLILGYFDDLLVTMSEVAQLLRPGGRAVYVVGNSLHGNRDGTLLVASDLLLARLAQVAGLSVERFVVARHTKRRDVSPFLRESVVFLRRPEGPR